MKKAFEILKDDHQKVKDIIHELKQNRHKAHKADLAKKSDQLSLLKKELKAHEKIEENLLYPILKSDDKTKELALEAYEEHATVNYLMENLEKNNFKNETWLAKLTVLEENLKHHIKEEESHLFQEATKILSEQDLEKLATDIKQMKEDLNASAKSKGE